MALYPVHTWLGSSSAGYQINTRVGIIIMADRGRVREQAFSLLSSTVGILPQSSLSSTRRFRRVYNQRVVHFIRRSRRRFVGHLIFLVVVALLWRQAIFSPIPRITWSVRR